MIKVALIYFGISRCPSKTIEGVYNNIIKPNEDLGVTFTRVSCLNMIESIHNVRSGEYDVDIDKSDILKIPSDYYFLFNQNKNKINNELDFAKKRQDPFCDDWNSVRNLLNQLYVLHNGWKAFKAVNNDQFDAYFFVRPDILYMDKVIIPELLKKMGHDKSILIPSWHSWGGLNDRCALARPKAAKYYTSRFNQIGRFCKHNDLHSESFLAWSLDRNGCYVGNLPLKGKRVRANGCIKDENFSESCIDIPDQGMIFNYNGCGRGGFNIRNFLFKLLF